MHSRPAAELPPSSGVGERMLAESSDSEPEGETVLSEEGESVRSDGASPCFFAFRSCSSCQNGFDFVERRRGGGFGVGGAFSRENGSGACTDGPHPILNRERSD